MTSVQDILDKASMSARDVFGEPYERDGIVVIPVARVSAGGGAGGGGMSAGSGHGWGVKAEPAGAFVIKDGNAVWRPAVNVNKVIAGSFVVAAVALWRAPKISKAMRRLFR